MLLIKPSVNFDPFPSASLPSLRRGLRQRSGADGRPIDGVHGRSESRFDLFDGLPFSE